MISSTISLLEPPYADPRPWIGRSAAPGAVAVVPADAIRQLDRVGELFQASPWVVPCVLLAPALVSPPLLQTLWALPCQPAFVILNGPAAHVSAGMVLSAVAGRPVPTVPHLAAQVVTRTESVQLGQTLAAIWSDEPDRRAAEAERTVRYRLRREGRLSRHDWLRVRKLIQAKTGGWNASVERQAQLVGTEARTLRAWVARYLGCSMRTFRMTAGWEWIIETTLRRAGFALVGAAPEQSTRTASAEGHAQPAPVRGGTRQ